MHQRTKRARRAVQLLLGTSSFTVLFTTAAFAGAAPATAPVEEVLITGSLIAGAPAVGVPVTQVSEEDFRETGSVTVSDVLRSLPSVDVAVNQSITASGAVNQKPQEVAIRGLSTGAGTETLMMINGMRFPIQGFSAEYVDPSIIAPLGVQRIDVLAEGASATYGTDAVAGVVNVILRRGYEGAITQVRFGASSDIGIPQYTFNALFGRPWDGGQVTVSFQYDYTQNAHGPVRDYFTLDFTPYGFDDRRPISFSNPATVSPAGSVLAPGVNSAFDRRTGARNCGNCFSIPSGTGWNYGDTPAHTNPLTPTPTTTWTDILQHPGIQNLHTNSEVADVVPSIYNARATLTFDQIIADDIGGVVRNLNLFVDGFYSNHRTTGFYTPGASPGSELALREFSVPTTNPYRPAGAPAGMLVSYNLAYEMGGSSRMNTDEVASRYAFGLEADLPFDWNGRIFYSKSEDKNYVHVTNMVNTNHVRAALGQTVPAGTGAAQGAFVKPANVPYLNLFCDATVYTCNAEATLNYIRGIRFYDQYFNISEAGANIDGPVFDLPGGTLQVALGADYRSDHYNRVDTINYTSFTLSMFDNPREAAAYYTYAVFGQVDIPVIGEMNRLPFVEAFNIQAAYRLDHYRDVGWIKTPKIGATWGVGYGLTLRGAWGKAFRAPSVAEASTYSVQIQGENQASGEPQDTFALDCAATPGLPSLTAHAGSLVALLNPTCSNSAALRFQGGAETAGGAGAAAPIRTGPAVVPEDARSWSLGMNFTPSEGFLQGLNVDVSYYKLRINKILDSKSILAANDPRNVLCTDAGPNCNYIVRANPALPITDPANARFLELLTEVTSNPRSTVKNLTNIQYIRDVAITNAGYREISGIDFDWRYDLGLGRLGNFGNLGNAGEIGSINFGIRGDYRLTDKELASDLPGLEVTNNYEGNTGGRLRWRGRLGWQSMDGAWSTTTFVNYTPHGAPASTLPPACFWSVSTTVGSCYPGSPHYGPFDSYPLYTPSYYWFDLNISYNTQDNSPNPYLQNLTISLTVNNVFNRQGAFTYAFGSGRGTAADQGAMNGMLQRFVSLSLSKVW